MQIILTWRRLAGREAARKALEEFRSESVEMQGPSTLLPVNAPASASTSATAVETPSVNAPSASVPASSEFANVPGSSFTTCAPSSNLAGDQSAPDMHEPAQPVNTPGEQVIPEAHVLPPVRSLTERSRDDLALRNYHVQDRLSSLRELRASHAALAQKLHASSGW